jgi:hypothetical protein
MSVGYEDRSGVTVIRLRSGEDRNPAVCPLLLPSWGKEAKCFRSQRDPDLSHEVPFHGDFPSVRVWASAAVSVIP